MSPLKVVVTGAGGYISNALLPAFSERYDLTLLDLSKETTNGRNDDIIEVDLTNPNIDLYEEHFTGADVIVHNARFDRRDNPKFATGPNHQWKKDRPKHSVDGYFAERQNLDMAYNIYKIALQKNIKRVVVASSNHAADWYETKIHFGEMDIVDHTTYPKSDNFYGWCKIAYEALGFAFATGRFGQKIESINIRIGGPRILDIAKLADNQTSLRRDLGAWISDRDLQQLYIKSIETREVLTEDGVPFQIFYGISNNTRAFWSIANARAMLKYEPQDDSEVYYSKQIRKHMTKSGRISELKP